MKSFGFKNIITNGEIKLRSNLNFNRLETEEYIPPKVIRTRGYSWPGDWEGRTLLALVLLEQSTKRKAVYLEEIMELIYVNLNKQGYFGKIMTDGIKDEQVLSGNSWLLRGIIEYYNYKNDEQVLKIIKNMVNNLILKTKGFYKSYPSNPSERVFEGEAMGSIVDGIFNNWITSTDIGCAFIMLDGATAAYELLKDDELKEVINEMIEKFLSIDLLELSCQTHATLTALRGMIRFYEIVKDEKLLEEIIKRYDLYMTEGITENYANHNWFRRHGWTEPCAIIDSYILSVML
jgi:hypothetical protein